MYGTYAAKAFLNANVAPLTYIRLLGEQTVAGKAAGGEAAAGWKTTNDPDGSGLGSTGGAYGLWVFASASSATQQVTASLGAIIYTQDGAPLLSGSIYGGVALAPALADGSDNVWTSYQTTASIGTAITADSSGLFHLSIQTANGTTNAAINFDDASDNFARN